MAGLLGLLIFFLTISWRRWPDPVIDFGRELYLPWRLSHGAVLYRDVDDVYGPLSQYLNAALFTAFGPGLMVLVAANLLVLGLIVALIYFLFRRAWGAGAAWLSSALFISVFSASQFGDTGNFNYLTPYSEETTHGLFVCLVLVFVLTRWVENGTRAGSFLAGFLCGLTLVLKPEFMLAGAALLATAWWLQKSAAKIDLLLLLAGGILPTLLFTGFFAVSLPLPEAASAASRAWWNAFSPRYSNYGLELTFLGLDQPALNLKNQSVSLIWAVLLFTGIAAAAGRCDKMAPHSLYLLATGFLTAFVLWTSLHLIHWERAARCLPGLLLIVIALIAARLLRQPRAREIAPRLLLAVLATALLARMILRPRVFDYGYYQAALAVLILPAFLLAEIPAWLKMKRRGTLALTAAVLALFVPGAATLAAISYQNLCVKTIPVGTGADRFYSSSLDPTGALVDSVSGALRSHTENSTLLVLPEGVMINYLARLPSPIAPYAYYASATADGREDQIVADLQSHPPDQIVIISRPLLEYGIARYGADPDEGRQLIDWVKRNYVVAYARGGNPLDITTYGVLVLSPKYQIDAPRPNR